MRVATAVFAVLITISSGLRADEAADVHFVRRVIPVLREKCVACHGQDTDDIKAGLALTTRAGLLKGGESGEASIDLKSPEASPLLLSISRQSDDWSAMPPKDNDRLSPEQIAAFKVWIASGAPWPDANRIRDIEKQYAETWAAEDGILVKTSGGLSPTWTNRRYKQEALWAYQPLNPLTIANRSTAIDELLAAKRPRDLPVAPPADRRTLIRRVTYDLIGLPPTPDEIDAFVNDPADDAAAFDKVVNRLLNSPHFGEQMARRWLDVTRYADSSGFANDYERGNAWRYRDYVVRAFNGDKPYD
ncbi:MAG TPA: DUF1549 domain-containing protein, partial [Caulifigura sp.]|nr:DUF1549 domain-containing protein [Caulifigura sp.]